MKSIIRRLAAPALLSVVVAIAWGPLPVFADLKVIDDVAQKDAMIGISQTVAADGAQVDFVMKNMGPATAGYVCLQVMDDHDHWLDRTSDLFERVFDSVKHPPRAHAYTLPKGAVITGSYKLSEVLESLKASEEMKAEIKGRKVRIVFRTFPGNQLVALSSALDLPK